MHVGNTRHLFYNRIMTGKRGAPYGNMNALQHGRYARQWNIEVGEEFNEKLGYLLEKLVAANYAQLVRLFNYTEEVADDPKRHTAAVKLFLRQHGRLTQLRNLQGRLRVKKPG